MKKKYLKLIIILKLLMIINIAVSEEVLPVVPTHHGGNVLTIAEDQRLEAQIGNAMNRLAVVNDRIVNIFGEEEAFTFQSDEHTGQVFIKPTPENGNKPIAITLVTENGVTQDLTLIPSRTKATTVILKPAFTVKPHASPTDVLLPGFNSHQQTLQQQWIEVIKLAVLGELPLINSKINPAIPKVPNLQVKFKKCYQSGQLLVTVWQVKNVSRELKELEEKQFFNTGDLALSLQHRILSPNKTTLLYVLGAV
jgi:type-F conjugative transfer system secretin TraK